MAYLDQTKKEFPILFPMSIAFLGVLEQLVDYTYTVEFFVTFAFGTALVALLAVLGLWLMGDTLSYIAVSLTLTTMQVKIFTVWCLAIYYILVLVHKKNKPVEYTLPADSLEPADSPESMPEKTVAFIPYMLMAYLIALIFQAF